MKLKVKLKESLLTEDKVVKFGGTTYPKSGWCVIMCGAPGTGKSSVLKNLIPIDAKIHDVDKLKDKAGTDPEKGGKGKIVDGELIFNGKHYQIPDNIKPPYTTKNPEFTSWQHKILASLNDKIKDNVFELGKHNKFLPNIAFDITGDKLTKFTDIIDRVIPMGYKVCIVWVLGTLQFSLDNNAKRDRHVPSEVVIKKYFNVLQTISQLLKNQSVMSKISDFWLVHSVGYSIRKDDGGLYKFIKDTNVEAVSSQDTIDSLAADITTRINNTKDELDKKLVNIPQI